MKFLEQFLYQPWRRVRWGPKSMVSCQSCSTIKRLKGYPKWFYHLLIIVLLTVTSSGLLMVPTLLEFKLDVDVAWRLSGTSRIWAAALHTLIGWLLLMQTGALWQAHMRSGWRKKLNRVSGASTALVLLLLAFTAGGLFYLGHEGALNAVAIAHTLLGLLMVGFAMFHIIKGRIIHVRKLA